LKLLLQKISKNDATLKRDRLEVKSQLRRIKQTLKRSANTVLLQKALYKRLTQLSVKHLPSHWNHQWLKDSDLISPSLLPRISKVDRIKIPYDSIESMQKTVGDLKIKICHISDNLQDWQRLLQDTSNDTSYHVSEI
jgi:hypothetical protein